MPSLLFPTGTAPRLSATGTFSCPSCGGSREYSRVVVGRVTRLFAIHIPIGVYGEYVECGDCLSTYRPEVLAYDTGAARAGTMSEYQRVLRRVLALLVITDGRVDEAEIRTMQRIYESVTGERLLHEDVLDEAADVARQPTTVARYLGRILGCLNDRGKQQVLRGAAMVTGADGHTHPAEKEMVRRLGGVLKLDARHVDDVLRDFA